MTKTLAITIEVPDGASVQSLLQAEVKAKEAAVMALQQAGEMTIREAAAELKLAYDEYLDLLSAHGFPASQEDVGHGNLDRLHEMRGL